MEFTFTKKAKMFTYILMAIGIVAIAYGYFEHDGTHHNRFWANMLIQGFFYFAVSLGALFFLALQYATESGWSVVIKRILESVMSYLPIGAAVIVLVLLVGTFGGHHIYHWMDSDVYKEAIVTMPNQESVLVDLDDTNLPFSKEELFSSSKDANNMFQVKEWLAADKKFTLANGTTIVKNPKFDHIIDGKSPYLNKPFFWFRTLVYMLTFILFARAFRKRSLEEDKIGGTKIHFINYKKGALFLVLFAVFSSTLAWDWIMSIDTHWFSTLFGWYVFSGIWISAMIMVIMLAVYLKSKDLIAPMNNSHLHDMGKWMFALSFLWSYLWFSQFLLIWYSDIPEEVTYFKERIEHFKVPFFLTFLINFALPMLILMSRDAKRNFRIIIIVGTVIFFGHWMDVYLMITPGTLHTFEHFGLVEIGMMLGFLGLFLFTVLRTLAKASLLPKNHPYLDESLHHHI